MLITSRGAAYWEQLLRLQNLQQFAISSVWLTYAAVLIGLGLILLGVSYLYQRYKAVIFGTPAAPTV